MCKSKTLSEPSSMEDCANSLREEVEPKGGPEGGFGHLHEAKQQ